MSIIIYNMLYTAVISIKHVSTFVNKVEKLYVTTMIFDLIDKCRYVFYAYDGSILYYIISARGNRFFIFRVENFL
jgi:hypothetical protein